MDGKETYGPDLGLQFHIDESVGTLDSWVGGGRLPIVHSGSAQRDPRRVYSAVAGNPGGLSGGNGATEIEWRVIWISLGLVLLFIVGLILGA